MATLKEAVLKVGDTFKSFEDLKRAIEAYEMKNYINYHKRDSRTMVIAQKRVKIDNPNPDLVYYEVKFTCIKGGKDYKSKTTSQRPNQR